MSVECNQIIGWTVKIKEDLNSDDFEKFDEFKDEHLELSLSLNDEPNRVYLVVDGMNGDYARLVYAEYTGTGEDVCDGESYLKLHDKGVPNEIFCALNKVYQELTGDPLDESKVEHSMWFHWS